MVERLSEQIIKGLDAGLYHLAFYVALTLPDIAGAIDDGTKAKNGDRYKKWFDSYAAEYFSWNWQPESWTLTGDECWRLRCGILHQGTTEYALYALLSDEPVVSTGIYPRQDEPSILDVDQFCRHMVRAFYDWIEEKESSFEFEKLEINEVSKGEWKFKFN